MVLVLGIHSVVVGNKRRVNVAVGFVSACALLLDLVLHLGVPPRPEAYIQEAGRAGRDGARAQCVMLWTRGDLLLAEKFADARVRARSAEQQARRRGFDAMRRYVHTRRCRRRVLMDYLGETGVRCMGCDRCCPEASPLAG